MFQDVEVRPHLPLQAAAKLLKMSPHILEHHCFAGRITPIYRQWDGVPVFHEDDLRRLGRELGKLPGDETAGHDGH